MSLKSGFFNSVNGDRLYNADDIGNYFDGLISNGVFESVGNRLAVTPGDGMSVVVDTGRAFINCHYMTNDTQLTLSLDGSDVQYKRIDRIVVRLDNTDSVRDVYVYVLKGNNAANPTPPSLTRNVNIYEICLANILIEPNATSIHQYNITDTRGNTDLCGFVTGIIDQVNTSDLFLQYQNAFETYFSKVTSELNNYFENKKAAFDSWFETLTDDLIVSTTLVQYQNTVTTTTETDTIAIGIPEYAAGDILLVHIGGVLFVQGSEFTVNDEGSEATITLTNSITADNDVTFICIKSVIGTSLLPEGGSNISATSYVSEVIYPVNAELLETQINSSNIEIETSVVIESEE